MNVETAFAHIEAYIAGGDELGDISDADALAALDILRNVITGTQTIVGAARRLMNSCEKDCITCHAQFLKELRAALVARDVVLGIYPTLAPDITQK